MAVAGEPTGGRPVVIIISKDGVKHNFDATTLEELGQDCYINFLIRCNKIVVGATPPEEVHTSLPAPIVTALSQFSECRKLPNPYLFENRVDGVSPDTLLEFLGIGALDVEVEEGEDNDPEDDWTEEDLHYLWANGLLRNDYSDSDEYSDEYHVGVD